MTCVTTELVKTTLKEGSDTEGEGEKDFNPNPWNGSKLVLSEQNNPIIFISNQIC